MDFKSIRKIGKIDRVKIREALKVIRRSLGKRTKVKRDTTVFSDSELYKLLDTKSKES